MPSKIDYERKERLAEPLKRFAKDLRNEQTEKN